MTTLMTLPKTQYSSLDDARLAKHARTDPQAFAELYRRHLRSIYRYHLAHTGDVRDAEDLTSQTFMAARDGSLHYMADRDRLKEARPLFPWEKA